MISSLLVLLLFLKTTPLLHLHQVRRWRMTIFAKHGHTMILLLAVNLNVMGLKMLDLESLVSTLLSVLMVWLMLTFSIMMDGLLNQTNLGSLHSANQWKRVRGHSSSAMCFLVSWETPTGALLHLKWFVKKLLMKSSMTTLRKRIKLQPMCLAN